ncbi:ABC transporter permease [Lactiplantibacillus paraplantarum]|uniref:ABC transporter permease n=1 Tax=Lactiplantibacillus paraplantarum TaxID=60520 RepID=UPI0021D17CC3|nr:ABC transporter permease [Lactiplantibacillus paraplantarum]MCU4683439.1 ABC transporter permease [Lactiplantibacillus paraplantarum]
MSAWIGLILYAIGLLGYNGTLRRLGVCPYLAWITAMLVQILILYGFAMMGWLTIGIQIVTYLGIGLALLWLGLSFLRRAQLRFEGIHLFDFWMIGLGIATGQTLWHSPLVHYDNFSHWAVMVKFMVFTGRLPGTSDHLISFTSYPPATALFITQFVHWIGFSDGAMLVAQFILIWGAAYAIFAGLRDRSRALTSFALCFTLAISFVFNVAIRLNNLLVDYVLPIITIAALVGIFVYRQRPILLCSHVAIFIAALLLVKNSATFFVIMIGGYFLYTLITNHHWQWRRLLTVPVQFAVTLGTGVLPFIWWEWHVKHIFTVSKHQISTQAYAKQLHGESQQALIKIGHKFLTQIFSLNSLSTKGILLINVVLILTWLFIRLRQHQRNNLLGMALLLDLIFIVYYGSLFGMYILSMPYAEAILLDGFERYMASIVILNLFIGAIALVRVLDRQQFEQNFQKRNTQAFKSATTKNIYQMATLVTGFFAITMMYSEITGTKFTNEMNHNTLPLQMTRVSKQWHHLNHRKVLIVDPEVVDVNDYYAGYVGRYWYFTDKAVGQESFMMTPKVFKQTVESYQYVAIPETHRTFTVLTKKVFHQHVVTGLFKVTKKRLICMH